MARQKSNRSQQPGAEEQNSDKADASSLLDFDSIGSRALNADYSEQDYQNALEFANGEGEEQEPAAPVQKQLSGFWDEEPEAAPEPLDTLYDEPDQPPAEKRLYSGVGGLELDKTAPEVQGPTPIPAPVPVGAYSPTPRKRTNDTGLAPQHVKFQSGVALRDIAQAPNVKDYRILVVDAESPRWYYISYIQQVPGEDRYSVVAGGVVSAYEGSVEVI